MIESLRKFIEGILGVPPEEDLDQGSFVQDQYKITPQPRKRIESTQPRIIERQSTEKILEDAGDLPLEKIMMPASRSRAAVTTSRSIILNEPTASFIAKALDEIQIVSPTFYWCLDNGHGKLQPGKRSPVWEDGTQLEEWKFTRQIVEKIIERLEPMGIQFFNVVPEEEVGSFLPERVERANDADSGLGLPKIYVSIHGNAAGTKEASGIECWHFLDSDSGTKLASIFQRHLIKAFGDTDENKMNHEWKDRGIRAIKPKSRNFFVLRETHMPSVLTENGFYTNPEECELMLDEEVQQKIADAHVTAILEIERNGYEDTEEYEQKFVIDL